jgi:hypothetical protein
MIDHLPYPVWRRLYHLLWWFTTKSDSRLVWAAFEAVRPRKDQ